MIENISYEEMLSISKELQASANVIRELVKEKNLPELNDFISTVEGYSKFLETTVELYQDADAALSELISKK